MYHYIICWISFSRSWGLQLPKMTTTIGLTPGSSQKTELWEFMNWASSQFRHTLKYEIYRLMIVLFSRKTFLESSTPPSLMNLISTSADCFFRMLAKRGILRHQRERVAISQALHRLSYFLRMGSYSTYLMLSSFIVWQQLLTKSQNSLIWVLNSLSSASKTLQYYFLRFFCKQAPILRAATSSYSSPSSIIIRCSRSQSVRISSSSRVEFLQSFSTELVTMVWKREISSLWLMIIVLIVQKTSSLENADSSWGS